MAKNLGQRIREVRLSKKLTQNDVVGNYMTRNMLSKIENGSAAPSVRTLEYLAVALDMPISYFLEGGDREAVDTEQLREIDELAGEIANMSKKLHDDKLEDPKEFGKRLGILSLCVMARTRLASGRPDAALEFVSEEFLNDLDEKLYCNEMLNHVYMILEDCYRLKGNFRLAYEYALKRLEAVE